jgi:hypothetical protein
LLASALSTWLPCRAWHVWVILNKFGERKCGANARVIEGKSSPYISNLTAPLSSSVSAGVNASVNARVI